MSIHRRLYWTAYLAYHLRGQARYPFRPIERILADQARRVQAVLAYAYRHVPYYQETLDRLGLRPGDFRSAADLARLPILERQELQRDPDYFLSTAQPRERCLAVRSGGSSGAPRLVYHSPDALFQNAAHGERERSILAALVGRRVGYRETVIASPISTALEVQQFCREHAFYPGRVRIERQYLSLLDPPPVNLARINGFRPQVIQSYGSYLGMLFAHLEATGAPFQRPALVTYSSDGLSEPARRAIERRFQIPVFSTYQTVEAFKIGFECEQHRGLHLNIDLYPLRIVDAEGRTLPPGESGGVVVSNLVNRGTVLLNYRLGDLAALLPERCPCGRSLPLLSFIEGRNDDLIELPSGGVIHPQAVRTIFTNEGQVWEYQVVQRSPTSFTVAVVAAEGCDRQALQQRIRTGFAGRFGQVEVSVSFVAALPRSPGGKSRPVVRQHE